MDQVTQLKARMFDMQEQINELITADREKVTALQEIVHILNVQAVKGEQIMLKDIVDAVAHLADQVMTDQVMTDQVMADTVPEEELPH